jgi:hypothetical protein
MLEVRGHVAAIRVNLNDISQESEVVKSSPYGEFVVSVPYRADSERTA